MATISYFNVALTVTAAQFVSGLAKAERQWDRFARSVRRQAKLLPESIQAAVPAALTIAKAVTKVGFAATTAATGLAGLFGRAAAQTEMAEVALRAVARANGLLESEVLAVRDAIKAKGITEKEANQITARFIQAQLDLSYAARVARVAQDAAVIAQQNSSEAAQTMVDAISSLNVQVLKQYGFTRNLNSILADHARRLGVSVNMLTEQQKKQALLNYILQEGEKIAGTYELAMTSVGKKMGSLPRYWSELANAVGRPVALPAMGIFVDNLTAALKGLTKWAEDNRELLSAVGQALASGLKTAARVVGWFGRVLAKATPLVVAFAGAITGALVPAVVAWLIPSLKKLGVSLLATLRPLILWMAIGAAVAATAYLLAKAWGHLGDVARGAWLSIGAVAMYGASLVVRGVGLILAGLGAIVPAFRGAAQSVLGLADSLKTAAAQSLSSARSALSFSSVVREVQKGQEGIAKVGQQAAETQEQLADGVERAAKAAADNLQSFDEVHTIQEEMATSSTMPEIPSFDIGVPAVGIGDVASAIGDQLSAVVEAAASSWDRLRQAMEPVNRAVQWIKGNWPPIGPIVEKIAALISFLLLPAFIRLGMIALANAGRVVFAWAMQGVAAARSVAVQLVQFVVAGARWSWLGIQAIVNAGKVALAWAIQGWQAVASAGIQVAQFALLIGRWLLLGVTATANALRVAEAWMVQRVQALASMQVQGVTFTTLIGRWLMLGAQAAANAARVVWAWIVQQAQAAASVAAQAPQFAVLVGRWIALAATAAAQALRVVAAWVMQQVAAVGSVAAQVVQIGVLAARLAWLGAQALFHAARMAAAWFIALGPVGWAIGVIALVAAVVATHWDQVVAWTQEKWAAVSAWVSQTWDNIKTWAAEKFGAIRDAIAGVWDAVKSSTVGIWNGIRDRLGDVWASIRDRAASVWEGIKDKIVGIWSGIWEGIKGWINKIIDAMNGFIRGLNRVHFSVPNWVPVIGGMSWGFNLPEIPRLAHGGIVEKPTLALVGERGPEAVVPLSRDNALADSIAQAVYQAVSDALRVAQVGSSPSAGDREIVLRIDGRTFARAVLPAVIAEGQRQGLQLGVRPRGV